MVYGSTDRHEKSQVCSVTTLKISEVHDKGPEQKR